MEVEVRVLTPGFKDVLKAVYMEQIEHDLEAYYRYDPGQVRARIKTATVEAKLDIIEAKIQCYLDEPRAVSASFKAALEAEIKGWDAELRAQGL